MHRLAEQGARCQRREEQHHGNREHQHLRAQSGAASVGNEHAPSRGEAEQGVIEHEPQSATEEEQGALTPTIGVGERERAGRQQRRGQSHHGRIDRRDGFAIGRKQPCVNGKVGHEFISASCTAAWRSKSGAAVN
jgi:hypothetical protein